MVKLVVGKFCCMHTKMNASNHRGNSSLPFTSFRVEIKKKATAWPGSATSPHEQVESRRQACAASLRGLKPPGSTGDSADGQIFLSLNDRRTPAARSKSLQYSKARRV